MHVQYCFLWLPHLVSPAVYQKPNFVLRAALEIGTYQDKIRVCQDRSARTPAQCASQ